MALRAAVIGAGRRGLRHSEALATLQDQVHVVAIAEVDVARAKAIVATHAPTATVYADATEMLERTQPDIVYVTTPPPLHREQAVAALRSGAHVVLEKPIALTNEDAEAIGAAARQAGRLVHVCHQLRYVTGSAELRQALANRKVALTHIWNYRPTPDIPGNWDRAWGGGHVVEWGIHYLDLCRYVLDTEPVEVYAQYTDNVLPGAPTWNNWDAYSLTIRWANGAVGSYASTYALSPGIAGASGLVIIAGGGKAEFGWAGSTWTTPDGTQTWKGVSGEGERTLSQTFLAAITTGNSSAVRQSFDDALRTHRLVMAANASALTGTPVRL
ncbi:MAG: Gfo/Idh/MocA family protein [Chloroflexota bacterium]